MKGYVHVYTGDGKGKTTAALGLIVRACGAGLRVYLCQFIKGGIYSEIRTLKKRFCDVTIQQCGRGCFIKDTPSRKDMKLARRGLAKLRAAMLSGKYDVIIADEANCAIACGLLKTEQFLKLIDEKPEHVELIFTGRSAPKKLIARADLVTEMKEVKHYFHKGIKARPGIED
ncbi:MAG: cob(I)yrinic acid a,c-diamide adenosyltransferase [Kiritimatiellae bacterium]|nr:cob(I)yrinic acid a,c-diamide adenosyltransferase [Kiritimatiellia bacterium]MDD5523027.1 cob(I)yrinic acid a,c-diamide adenosyltransferase [Kiritimatiellia bacterium]